MKKIFITRVLFALMLLLTAFARGQTISNVVVSTPACLGSSVTVTITYSGFASGQRTFNVEASDNAGNFTSSELFDATVTAAGNATTRNQSVTLKTTATPSSAYKIRVTSVTFPAQTFTTPAFAVNIKPGVPPSRTNDFVCSGSPYSKDLQPLITNSIASDFAWTVNSMNPAGSVTGSSAGSDAQNLTQTLTTAATTGDPYVNYSVVPTAESSGCVGEDFTVRVYVARVENPGAFATTSKTICSGALSEAIPTLTATTVLIGDAQAPVTYQWQRNGFDIPSATSATFTETDPLILTNTSGAAISYTYTRLVSLGGCTPVVTTNSYILTVMTQVLPGSIIAPVSTFCASVTAGAVSSGQPINTLTPASGDGVLTYNWQVATNVTTLNWSGVSPAVTTDSYTLPATALTADRLYRRGVTATLNGTTCTNPVSVYTDPVTITINKVTNGSLSGNQELCKAVGGADPVPVELSATAPTGDGTLTYSWERSTANSNSFTSPTEVGTDATYTPVIPLGANYFYYRRKTTSTLNDVACALTTGTDYVSVNTIDPGTISGGGEICPGTAPAPLTGTVGTATGGAVTYEWQSSTTSGADFTPIGVTTQNLTSPSTLTQTTYFRRITRRASSSVYAACEAISNELTVTVNEKPVAAASAKEICSNDVTALEVTNPNNVSGATFDWTATYGAVTGGAGSGTGVTFGSTAINETLINTTGAPIVVTYTITPKGPAPTNCPGDPIQVAVTVNPQLSLATLTLADGSYNVATCDQSSANLKVVLIGGTSPYKVKVYGLAEVTGYTSGSNIPTGALAANVTPYSYSIEAVSDAKGCPAYGISGASAVNVQVNKAPASVTIANASGYTGDICRSIVTYNSTLNGTVIGTPVYAWSYTAGGPPTALSGTPNQASASQDWKNNGEKTVTLSVSVPGCPSPVVSDGLTFRVRNQPTVAITGAPLTAVCEGSPLTLEADVSGGITPASNRSYAWVLSTDGGFMFGSTLGTNATYAPTAAYSLSGTVYKVILSYPVGSNCNTVSAQVPVTVNKKPDATAQATVSTICTGATAQISVSNPNGVGATFKWTAVYTGVTGGMSSGTGVAFGTNVISETLTTTGSTAGTAVYTITPVGPAGTYCEGTPAQVTITVNPLPVTPTITPDGATTFCQGQSVNLSAPASSSYLWSNDATTQTINVSATGTFTVKVKDGNGCESLPSAPLTVTVNPLPTKPTVSASGPLAFCQGGSVTLTSSAVSGNTWNPGGATTQSITVNSSGTYTVSVSDANQCVAVSDNIGVTVHPLPVVYNVIGGGISFCSSAVFISLTGSQPGVNYQLKRGNTLVSTEVGTGYPLEFFGVNQAGTYTVVAVTVAGGCSLPMSGSAVVSVAAAPTLFTVSGGGTSCGGELKGIRLSDSQVGVSYQLKRGSTVIDVRAGTGAAIDFDAQSAAGNYTVVALSPCNDRVMNGSATITAVAFPTVFSVTGGGEACGSSAVPVGLSGSQSGVSYQLYRGSTPVGTTVLGNGSALSLGSHNITGEYAVKAKNSAGCETWMYGSAIVIIYPAPTVFTVTGGGPACGAGAVISLSGSQWGLSYQLKRGTTNVGSPVPGNGAALSFDPQSVAGTYTVVTTTPCNTPMSGSVSVTSTGALPLTYNVTVTNNGRYCNNTPVGIGLSDTQSGKYYQLQRKNASNVFVNVGSTISGTGSAISLGSHSTLGTYQVVVSSVCGNIPMNNLVEISACNPAARIAAEDLDAAPQPWAAIAPNPVVSGRASLLIRNQANQTVTWQMMDLQGRTVSNGSFEALTNAHREDLNVRDVKVGNYLLNVQTGTKTMNLKVMKVE